MDLTKFIDNYITSCDYVIELNSENQAKDLEYELISIFQSIIKDIYTGLDAYSHGVDVRYGFSHIKDIKILKGKLILLKLIGGEYSRFNSSNVNNVSIKNDNGINNSGNSTNTNTNTNTVDIKAELSKVRDEIKEDEMLEDKLKEEIFERLDEIETVINDNPTNNEKWKKLKETISWIGTKSYGVAKLVAPLVIKAIFTDAQ